MKTAFGNVLLVFIVSWLMVEPAAGSEFEDTKREIDVLLRGVYKAFAQLDKMADENMDHPHKLSEPNNPLHELALAVDMCETLVVGAPLNVEKSPPPPKRALAANDDSAVLQSRVPPKKAPAALGPVAVASSHLSPGESARSNAPVEQASPVHAGSELAYQGGLQQLLATINNKDQAKMDQPQMIMMFHALKIGLHLIKSIFKGKGQHFQGKFDGETHETKLSKLEGVIEFELKQIEAKMSQLKNLD